MSASVSTPPSSSTSNGHQSSGLQDANITVFTAADGKTFETIPNPHPTNTYTVTIAAPEFTCLCPVTGHPDFATVTVDYDPGARIVELRSFKLYLQSFRNEGHFHEGVANRILNDLVGSTSPRRMTVTTDYTVRGGIHTVVTARFVDEEHGGSFAG